MLSDPADLKVPAFAEVAITIYLPEKTPASSTHFWAQHETYISGPGDFTSQVEIPNATVRTSWYWLSDVEVWGSDRAAATIAFGDSITDGVGRSKENMAIGLICWPAGWRMTTGLAGWQFSMKASVEIVYSVTVLASALLPASIAMFWRSRV